MIERARMTSRRWAVAALLVLGASGPGMLWWRGRPERHLARAEQALLEGDPHEALGWLAVPEADPGTRDRALLVRARLAVERGWLSEAVRVLDRVDPEGASAGEFAYWKGRTLYAARQPMLAAEWFGKALARRPGDLEASRWLAAAAYDLGDRATAVSSLQAVTRGAPKDARAWRTLGMIFKEDVDYEPASAAFERSLALDPDQPAVRLEQAETLLKLGDLDRSERELAACRGRVEEGHRAEVLGECLGLRGDREAQMAAVDAGLAAEPGRPGLLAQRAQIDLADGHPVEALRRLDRAVEADPHRPDLVYRRGVVLRALGRSVDARRDFDRAEALNKGLAEMASLNARAANDVHDPDVRTRLGRLCTELGKPELAAYWYRAALAADPKHEPALLGIRSLREPGRGAGAGP